MGRSALPQNAAGGWNTDARPRTQAMNQGNQMSTADLEKMTDSNTHLGTDAEDVDHHSTPAADGRTLVWLVDDGDVVFQQTVDDLGDYVRHVRAEVGWRFVRYSSDRLDDWLCDVVETASGEEGETDENAGKELVTDGGVTARGLTHAMLRENRLSDEPIGPDPAQSDADYLAWYDAANLSVGDTLVWDVDDAPELDGCVDEVLAVFENRQPDRWYTGDLVHFRRCEDDGAWANDAAHVGKALAKGELEVRE